GSVVRQKAWRADSEFRFLLIWLVSMFAILSLAGFKRADYLLPAYPGAALILGSVAESWFRLWPRRVGAALALIVAGCAVGWWVYIERVLAQEEGRCEQRSCARAILQSTKQRGVMLFFRTEAHALAFHLGPPLTAFVEWEGLDQWVSLPAHYFVVMPPECVEEWPRRLTTGRLEKV